MDPTGGGRFDFDDGGTYAGGWRDGKAHGHGLCTGPKGQGQYAGTWELGFEACGVYEGPGGRWAYEGQWATGRRHGLGVEARGAWVYRGEWTDGLKGRYGGRQSVASGAKYDGTWAGGLQDGYGSETYSDGGTFQGQWTKGMRHGYGVRSSAPFGVAAIRRPSVRQAPEPAEGEGAAAAPSRRPEECRGGFVLRDFSAAKGTWGRSLPDHTKPTKGHLLPRSPKPSSFDEFSEGSEPGSDSDATEASFAVADELIDANVIETYMGEWKNDRRSGFGIAERSDGIKYEGEWHNNKKFGYGLTTYKSGIQEYGKYKNNVLLQSGGKKHLFLLRSAKFKSRVQAAVSAAHRASQIALQKADIAISRTATARGKAEQADEVARQARKEAEIARHVARHFAPEFQPPGPGQLSKYNSSQDLSDFPPHIFAEDASHHSFQISYPGETLCGSPRDSYHHPEDPPPAVPQSAFLDVLRNTLDRRPSTSSFVRRRSTVAEAHSSSPGGGHNYAPRQPQPHQLQPGEQRYHVYQKQHQQQQQARFQQSQFSPQQLLDDHFHQYYDPPTSYEEERRHAPKRPAIDLTEISQFYGIPLSSMMDDEEGATYLPQRRSTLPTVLDPNLVQADSDASAGDGIVRSGSLHARKAEPLARTLPPPRKKSLPDVVSPGAGGVISREAIALLSSQRREAIRRQEEEAQRLRANPLLYLLSPEVWDWLASQQLVILVLVINLALGLFLFKVVL